MTNSPEPTVAPRPPSRVRHVRVPDELWRAAAAQAYAEGTTIGVVVNRLLREYVAEGEGLGTHL